MLMKKSLETTWEEKLVADGRWAIYSWVGCQFIKLNIIYIIVFIIWVCEWLIVFEYIYSGFYFIYFIFPIKITLILVVSIFYWIYLWSMAVWRRAQYGKFTRGERELWAKGYGAFWIVEIVTIGAFILVYCWLSWGPLILIPRYFIIPRKGLITEFIIYSYIIFLLYIAKFNMKWNLWNIQLLIALFIVIILSYLLWRDITVLITRDNLAEKYNARWRNIKLTALIYSMSAEWWVKHMLGQRSVHYKYMDLNNVFLLKKSPFKDLVPLTEYETNLWLTRHYRWYRVDHLYVELIQLTNMNYWYKKEFLPLGHKSYFYPRRIGYIPKRRAIWELLVFLKMWHQLVILVWWLIYIFRLNMCKGGSYSLLSVCFFNVYCCYILSLIIYSLNFFIIFELILKYRFNVFSIIKLNIFGLNSVEYLLNGILSNEYYWKKFELVKLFRQIS